MKNFLDWIQVKIKVNFKKYQPLLITEGDIWWINIGENVGSEINGKGEFFTRPVIIFKKLSRHLFFVIPTSTQIHTGRWYMQYKENGKDVVACLHQARTIDHRRLSRKLGSLCKEDLYKLKLKFQELYNPVSYVV